MELSNVKNSVIKLGQAHACESQSGIVYKSGGVSPTIISGTHGYAIGYILEVQILRPDQFLHRCELLEGNDTGNVPGKTQETVGD